MMHITVIAVGKLKEQFWTAACAEYLKRLSAYAVVEVRELPDIDPARAGGEAKARAQESASIVQALDALPNVYVVLLDIGGKTVASEDIASRLDALVLEGTNDVALVIGGSCGVDDPVRQRANVRWSLGRITLPHNLARVVILEQLYRAFKINRNEPYHK